MNLPVIVLLDALVAGFAVCVDGNRFVEYARFCGERCECVGYGARVEYDERRARSIARMLRKIGRRVELIPTGGR